MPQPKPETPRPYAAEYHVATGHEVHHLWFSPFLQMVDAGYAAWLEAELAAARGKKRPR